MSDLVERLRSLKFSSNPRDYITAPLDEAADEIERLRAEREKDREAMADALAELSPLMMAYRPRHYRAICGALRARLAQEAEGRG